MLKVLVRTGQQKRDAGEELPKGGTGERRSLFPLFRGCGSADTGDGGAAVESKEIAGGEGSWKGTSQV